jgi:DNA mismatch repair protein MutS
VERQRTGIKSLKVGYNRVLGYIEITQANTALVLRLHPSRLVNVNAISLPNSRSMSRSS